MSNVIPIRACGFCDKRKRDVVDRGLSTFMCDDCYDADPDTQYEDPGYTDDPDDD